MKSKILLYLCSLALMVYACAAVNGEKKHKKFNGVSFVSMSHQPDSIEYLLPAEKLDANSLCFMPYGFVRNEGTEIIYNQKRQWWGETKAGVAQMLAKAKTLGYSTLLKPQVWKAHGEYTGHHEYKTEADWLAFEHSYEAFILDFAKLADSMQVDLFCIGTEWEQFVSQRTSFWKNLIQKVRTVYSGKITYAANWDEYHRIDFWPQLDYIGIDAYFPLSPAHTPEVTELVDSLKPIQMKLKTFSDEQERPILFTEYGYRSVDYNSHKPWESQRSEAVNLKAQLHAYEAFYKTFWQEEYIAGGFIWKWFPKHDEVGGENHAGFTPQNKAVEKVIKEWY